jgi:uncharacterized protein (DUF433 family)
MNSVDTLSKAESLISGLSIPDKKQLLRWLEHEVHAEMDGIVSNDGVMGGAACIRQTRIPVWLLEQARRQGVSEADMLRNYPHLTAQDLTNAWRYVEANRSVIDEAIAENDAD